MSHHERKLVRARAHCNRIFELAETCGQIMPAHYPGCAEHMIVIDIPPFRITIQPNRFRAYMAKSEHMVGEGTIERDGWKAIEIRLHNARRACFNVHDDEIDMYHYQPGRWELEFGVDPEGDTVPIRPDLFADDKDPAWRAFKQSEFAKWPKGSPPPGA